MTVFFFDIQHRMMACWRLKAWLTAGLNVLFCVPYFLLGNYPIFPVHDLPLTWIDRAIGFHPRVWVWVYLSFYLPVQVIPWLADRRDDLLRFVKGFAIVSSLSFMVYLVYPTRSPAIRITPDATGIHQLLLAYDPPLNALPSLHAGLLVYVMAFGWRVFRRMPKGLAVAGVAWSALILYATLATKEHYAVDIVSGAALALAIDALVWRGRGRINAETPIQVAAS